MGLDGVGRCCGRSSEEHQTFRPFNGDLFRPGRLSHRARLFVRAAPIAVSLSDSVNLSGPFIKSPLRPPDALETHLGAHLTFASNELLRHEHRFTQDVAIAPSQWYYNLR